MLLSAEELLLFLLDEQHGTFLPITERTEDLVLAGAVLLTLHSHNFVLNMFLGVPINPFIIT